MDLRKLVSEVLPVLDEAGPYQAGAKLLANLHSINLLCGLFPEQSQ
jgi:hypothetical protein